MREIPNCSCGKDHSFASKVIVCEKAIYQLPNILEEWNVKNVFMIADKNTYAAAGKAVAEILQNAGIKAEIYVYSKDVLEPDETNVGLAMMYFNPKADAVIGVGSGVINDISKIVANVSQKPYIIVATAPSMDGYASATSSMTRDGLKISLNSKCADAIIGDVDILCQAPMKMMVSGLGDMLAKYVSICEWRIAHLLIGEYYCEEIAQLVRESLKKCVDNAEGLLKRDKTAVTAVFDGLVTCGAAMKYAGVSRPASGVEHYISHVWDMRGVEFGTPMDMHGIQCGIGTLIAIKLYEKVKKVQPNREKALQYVSTFDFAEWSRELRTFFGKAAESMIELEAKEQKYNKAAHEKRLDFIIEKWDDILQIIEEELPSSEEIEALLKQVGAPTCMEDIGLEQSILSMTFQSTKDIRDKYVLSRLCWDLGILEEMV